MLTSNFPRHVVIVGGGFGGLRAAKELARKPGVRVTLLDRRNHHLFQPLLYQVATAGLNPADIAVPIRGEFSRAPNVAIQLAEVESVSLDRRTIRADGRELGYDFLILACGAQHSYFGRPDWEDFAPGLKTLEQATEIRRRILTAFETAENETDAGARDALLSFVVIGGGPTGVELAGAVAEISRTVLFRDFRNIDPKKTRVTLIEASPRILAQFPEELSARAKRDLAEMGVEVRTGMRVTAIDSEGVWIGLERLCARTVLWAAGVEPAAISGNIGAERDRMGRIKVGMDLSIPGHPNAFVIGDQAHFEQEPGSPLPGLAPVAIQQGRQVARNILREIRGAPRIPFRYVDKGQMATIGKRRAVLSRGRWRMGGYIAWLGWLFVHLFYLVGFKNRASVLGSWIWSYVFSKRGARLITRADWHLFSTPQPPGTGSASRRA